MNDTNALSAEPELDHLRATVRDLETQISALALANVHAAELVVALEEAREREDALLRRGEEMALQSRLDALFQLERRESALRERARREIEATRGLGLLGPIRELAARDCPDIPIAQPKTIEGNLLHLPIHAGETIHAVWVLRVAEPDGPWRERWLEQLWSFGGQIGMAIQRLHAEEEIHRLNDDLIDRIAALQRATQRQSTAQTVTTIFAEAPTAESGLPRVLEAIGRGLDWAVASHWPLDAEETLHCRHVWTDGRPGLEHFLEETASARYRKGEAFPGATLEAGRAIWVDDFARYRNYARQASAESAHLHSGVAFPIVGARGILGVVEFVADGIRPLDAQLLAFFDSVGSQLGQFIERKEAEVERALAEAEVRRLAHNDPLTGLHNRLYLTTALDDAVASARARGANLALMFLDLDRFKPINDTLGHAVGDKLLCEVAARLRKSVRDSDIVARVG
ncbi:MAG: diguanylate cyclase domain-containing protein, partial [Armatimonadota bacterium]